MCETRKQWTKYIYNRSFESMLSIQKCPSLAWVQKSKTRILRAIQYLRPKSRPKKQHRNYVFPIVQARFVSKDLTLRRNSYFLHILYAKRRFFENWVTKIRRYFLSKYFHLSVLHYVWELSNTFLSFLIYATSGCPLITNMSRISKFIQTQIYINMELVQYLLPKGLYPST